MPDVIAPPRFNEVFTISLDADGQPVEKPLREMTADEVWSALSWYHREVYRTERATSPYAEMTAALEAGTLDPNTPGEEVMRGAKLFREAAEVQLKEARLLSAVRSSMPEWRRHPDVKLGEAMRRWWPTGRA